MIVFLIILASLVAVGLPLYLLHRYDERREARNAIADDGAKPSLITLSTHEDEANSKVSADASTEPIESDIEIDDEVCCGMHITCEKDSLLADVSETIDYFDDEELDRYAGRVADAYTPEEIEEFRDVLLTLLPTDIAPWARSIQLRGITLPSEVREELLMIVAEARESHQNVNN